MQQKIELFRNYLFECFEYNQESGEVRWKARPEHHFKSKSDQKSWNSRYANTVPGYIKSEYGNRVRPRSVVLMNTPCGSFTNYDCIRICAFLIDCKMTHDSCVFPKNGNPIDTRADNIIIIHPESDPERHKSVSLLDYLSECFDVDFDSGVLYWKARPSDHFESIDGWFRFNRIYPGRRADVVINGRYFGVQIKRNAFFQKSAIASHRVLWMLKNGMIPESMVIDHINGDGMDNRACNLRLASQQENTLNRKTKIRKSSLPANVNYANGKFSVSFGFTVKFYDSEGDAAMAAAEASKKWHGDFSRLGMGEDCGYEGDPLTIKVRKFLLGEIDEIVHKKKASPIAE
jgi:hypothetical protein